MKTSWSNIYCLYLLQICAAAKADFSRTTIYNKNHTMKESASASLLETFHPIKRITRGVLLHKKSHARQRCFGCRETDGLTKEGVCTRKGIIRIMRYSREELKCQPEPIFVKLELPGPQFSVEPAFARVKRCSGHSAPCRHSFRTCIPTSTSFVKVPVVLTEHSTKTGITKCVEYEVEQHDSCSCGCLVEKEHCSERHKHENCSCKCINEYEMYRCLDESSTNTHHKKIWDEEKCACICLPEECGYGLIWNEAKCRCETTINPSDLENLIY